LLGLYYIGTFIDKSERFFKGQANGWMFAQFLYFSTPQFIAHVVPMAILIAVLATIGGLTRTSELVVMRACGVSLYRAALPLLLLAFVWSGGLFALDDRVLARANRRAEALEDQIRGNPPQIAGPIAGANWLVDKRGLVYYYTVFDIPKHTLHGLSVFEFSSEPFRLVSHTTAASATYQNGAWRAERGWTQRFTGTNRVTREGFNRRALRLEPPDQFATLRAQEVELMTFGQLRRHIQDLSQSGFSITASRVTLQERVAFPMVTVVMTILGVPFGAMVGRRGALYGIGLATILGSAYWLLNTFFLAVGQAELLRPELAAWAANILFLSLAAYMTLRVRT
jgi:LPS export ABC transporter permease LptG